MSAEGSRQHKTSANRPSVKPNALRINPKQARVAWYPLNQRWYAGLASSMAYGFRSFSPKLSKLLVWSAMLLPLTCAPSHAQRATISGTITDQHGAVIPEVKITLLNLDQGLKRETTTNAEGLFVAPWLQPGAYVVTAQKVGFAVAELKDVLVHVGDVRGLRMVLQVGVAPVEIEVRAQDAGVETVSPALGKVVTGDVIRNAPLNGRNVLDLAILQPGVTPTDLDDSSPGGYTIAGGRSDSITYLLNGGLNNDLIDNRVVYDPNPDTIAEFRILTSNYPAEYGRNSGGIISMVTKSGTNQYHGSAFDFLRNDALDANSFFNKNDPNNLLPRDVLKRNQFGGTIGGPLTVPHVVNGEDRMFFFAGYQGQRQRQTQSIHNVVTFTPAELGGDFSHAGPGGTPEPNVVCYLTGFFPDGSGCAQDSGGRSVAGIAHTFFQPNANLAKQAIIDPTRINSVAKNYVAAGLIPTSPTGQLSSQAANTFNRDELTTKFDFSLSSKDRLAVTLGRDRTYVLEPFPFAGTDVSGYPVSSHFSDWFSTFAYTRTISPNLLNELSFTAQRTRGDSDIPARNLPTPAALGIGITPDISTGPTFLNFDSGLSLGFSVEGPQHIVDNTFVYSDTLTWVRGTHNLKFGGEFSAFQDNTQFAFTVDGMFEFFGPGGIGSQNSFADFLLGIPTAFIQSPDASSNIRSKYTDAFAQDEWHVRKNLVLTTGLRYEFSTPKVDNKGRTFSIIPGEQSRVFVHAPVGMVFPGDRGAPRGVNFSDERNWAPRFGFAWTPFNSGKTSVRGGFGLFYDILKGEDNLQFNGKPPFYSSVGFGFLPLAGNPSNQVNYMTQPFAAAGVPNPFPSSPPPSSIDFAAAGFLPIGASNNVYVVDPNLRTPYTYHYNLSLQQEVLSRTVLEASYVGSSAHGLTSLVDVNPFIIGTSNRILNLTPGNSTCTFTSGLCSFGTIREFRNDTNASYNSMELSLQKEFGDAGIFGRSYFTLAYTVGHNIDNASGFRNRNSAVPYYNPQLFRASADTDIRHRIMFSGGWELPVERISPSAPRRLTRGWSLFPILSWRSGLPLDVFANLPGSFDFRTPGPSGAGDPDLVRANLTGPIRTFDPHAQHTFAGQSGNYGFDPTSFSNTGYPATPSYGTLPRNYFRGPGVFNVNLAFSKTTPITGDRLKLEFRADFFNLLNHAEFLNPNTNINDPNFGKVQDTYPPRIIQLAMRLMF